MLHLEHISLTQFRNYDKVSFGFPGRITAFCGPNGVGKTNILDAIYYLCFTRSYSGRTDSSSVRIDSAGFRIDGRWNRDGQHHSTVCILRESGKKEFQVDNESITRFSGHIGHYPAVMITPDDIELISGSSEERRRFIDTLLSQLYREYLEHLIRYGKLLTERNSLLKRMSEGVMNDSGLLDVLDEQLINHGNAIFLFRKNFSAEFISGTSQYYQNISGGNEKISISYRSVLTEHSFEQVLKTNRSKDLALQRTSSGVHRDDLEIFLGEFPFKMVASQGQRKSLLFALKLAEFETLKAMKGFSPLLLLDDIFEKLDEQRMMNLLHWVCEKNEGQVFLTDTHQERIRSIMNKFKIEYQLIILE
ncbi:DNA replication/repair protein RecF [Pollutibacter soli]|uniref:DNA replication/repair protein RecF n=1 Tax=Pollutibacter soli TaxID=3034157 RepID=UPI00301408DF